MSDPKNLDRAARGEEASRGSPAPATEDLAAGSAERVEHITCDGQTLVIIIRADFDPNQTHFLTPPEFKQQVGFVVYPAGGQVSRHVHRAIPRQLIGTSEVLLLRKGRCLIDIYGNDRTLVATRELHEGDLMLMVDGGHGFRMIEDTTFLEIKQGPYTGLEEKERF